MPSPRAHGRATRVSRRRSSGRFQRLVALTIVFVALVITLVLTAFGAGTSGTALPSAAATPGPLAPAGLPLPQIAAVRGSLRIQLPIAQGRVTAIGYHGAGEGALALEPLGKQGNQGLLRRFLDRFFGSGSSNLVWYQLGGGEGPSTSSLDVGAAPRTDVFSPVDGTVVGISDLVIDGRPRGVRVEIQPVSAPALVVSVARIRPDPALTVGSPVTSAKTRIGTVLDLSHLERQALARYTQDAGNHVSIEVRPAATLALP